MYPELPPIEITAVAIAAGLLCIGAQFLESRRCRKKHDPKRHDQDRVAADMRAGIPLCQIRENLDEEENQRTPKPTTKEF